MVEQLAGILGPRGSSVCPCVMAEFLPMPRAHQALTPTPKPSVTPSPVPATLHTPHYRPGTAPGTDPLFSQGCSLWPLVRFVLMSPSVDALATLSLASLKPSGELGLRWPHCKNTCSRRRPIRHPGHRLGSNRWGFERFLHMWLPQPACYSPFHPSQGCTGRRGRPGRGCQERLERRSEEMGKIVWYRIGYIGGSVGERERGLQSWSLPCAGPEEQVRVMNRRKGRQKQCPCFVSALPYCCAALFSPLQCGRTFPSALAPSNTLHPPVAPSPHPLRPCTCPGATPGKANGVPRPEQSFSKQYPSVPYAWQSHPHPRGRWPMVHSWYCHPCDRKRGVAAGGQ